MKHVVYQTDTSTTGIAMRGDPYQVYASFVREIFAIDLADWKASWNYDELAPLPWEHHLRHVELLIAFRSARFVVI